MSTLTTVDWLILFSVSLLAAALALWLHGAFALARDRVAGAAAPDLPPDGHFLLEDHDIIGQDVQALPADHPARSALCWEDLHDWLVRRFGGVPRDLQSLPEGQSLILTGESATLDLLRRGSRTRIVLSDRAGAAAEMPGLANVGRNAMIALSFAPDPIWRTDRDGGILWQNAAATTLFDDERVRAKMMSTHQMHRTGEEARICIACPDGGEGRWYDIRKVPAGDHMLHFARDITGVIQAESARRDFVQTLTKTFSNLTTGLAIFDRTRRLALFNPALLDLTGAQVDFLSARPDLMDFFDRLREAQIMPEPRNYADWRAQIRDAVTRANDGLYQDLWSLPNGLTYRITGRPHPDGAIAFLFEDISAEISLTRRFRTQIELRQSVLDNLDEAVAVFAPNNLLMFCNTACTDLLKTDPESSFADMSLRDFLTAARTALGDSAELRAFGEKAFVAACSDAASVVSRLADGRCASCRITPLTGGARMLTVGLTAQVEPPRLVARLS